MSWYILFSLQNKITMNVFKVDKIIFMHMYNALLISGMAVYFIRKKNNYINIMAVQIYGENVIF